MMSILTSFILKDNGTHKTGYKNIRLLHLTYPLLTLICRVLWRIRSCFMATTTTMQRSTGVFSTTSLWPTSSLLSSTLLFVSVAS